MPRVPHAFLALLALVAAACASDWHGGGTYAPAPASATARPDPSGDGTLRVLATVIGIRRADAAAGRGPEVEVRLRLENRTHRPARLDPGTLSLVNGALVSLALAGTEPSPPPEVAPQGAGTVTARFRVAEGDDPEGRAFDGLDLRWEVVSDDRRLNGDLTFARDDSDLYRERVWGPWHGSYWDPWYGAPGWRCFEPDVIVVRPRPRPRPRAR